MESSFTNGFLAVTFIKFSTCLRIISPLPEVEAYMTAQKRWYFVSAAPKVESDFTNSF
jgi:hypothetical protein